MHACEMHACEMHACEIQINRKRSHMRFVGVFALRDKRFLSAAAAAAYLSAARNTRYLGQPPVPLAATLSPGCLSLDILTNESGADAREHGFVALRVGSLHSVGDLILG
jgi:hypothetical protein